MHVDTTTELQENHELIDIRNTVELERLMKVLHVTEILLNKNVSYYVVHLAVTSFLLLIL